MRHSFFKFRREGSQFKKEFRREIRMLIVVTIGFTIAFTWRQTVFDLSQSFVGLMTNIQSSSALSFLTSSFITFVALILIFITSHLLKSENNGY